MLTVFAERPAPALVPAPRRAAPTLPPFGMSPDPRFMYRSDAYVWAFEQVMASVRQREGIVLVTGEGGTGKTLLCRTLLSRLGERVPVSVVLDPCVRIDELLQKMLRDFGVLGEGGQAGRRYSRHELVETLHRFLASLIPLNTTAVVIIDEAQHMRQSVLEQLRLLSNCESDQAKLLQIVLVGTPALDSLCRSPEMQHFEQRIARRCRLGALRQDEVSDYITCRLTAAMSEPASERASERGLFVDIERGTLQRTAVDPVAMNPFAPAAIDAIATVSRGVPRLINLLGERSLEIAARRGLTQIDAKLVRIAAAQVNLVTPRRWFAEPRTLVMSAALLAVVVPPATWVWSQTAKAPAAEVRSQAQAPSLAPLALVPDAVIETLAATDGLTIQVAAFRNADRPGKVVQQLRAAGLPAFERTLPGDTWHLVLVGPYVTPGEVDAAQQAIGAEGFADTKIVRDDAGSVLP